jgi:hypothetical protein
MGPQLVNVRFALRAMFDVGHFPPNMPPEPQH